MILLLNFSNSLTAVSFSEQSVYDKLLKLKASGAPGPDGIPSIVIMSCAAILAEPLCYIYNLSLTIGVLPSVWKVRDQ